MSRNKEMRGGEGVMITFNKQTQFNNIYNNLYKEKLISLEKDPKKYMLTLGLFTKGVLDYPFETRKEFKTAYFNYLKDVLGYDSLLETYNFYDELYFEFYEMMYDELMSLHLSEEDICLLYANRTIYNFYKGFQFEKSVIDIIDEDKLMYRDDNELKEEIDSKYKIDIELYNTYNQLIGIQCKTNTYLKISKKTQSYHIGCMSRYIKEFGAETTYYILHDSNNQPMKLVASNTYLIPYKDITNCTMDDFIVGTFEELSEELNNL